MNIQVKRLIGHSLGGSHTQELLYPWNWTALPTNLEAQRTPSGPSSLSVRWEWADDSKLLIRLGLSGDQPPTRSPLAAHSDLSCETKDAPSVPIT